MAMTAQQSIPTKAAAAYDYEVIVIGAGVSGIYQIKRLVDLGVRAIVVRGAGDKSFISGADIAEFDVQRNDAATNRSFTDSVTAATGSLLAAPVTERTEMAV